MILPEHNGLNEPNLYESEEQTMSDEIRPFKMQVSDADLKDLKKRLRATRWPDLQSICHGMGSRNSCPLGILSSGHEPPGQGWRSPAQPLRLPPWI